MAALHSLLSFALLLSLTYATSLPTSIRMRRSSVSTTLSCKESCVADGIGMSLVQDACDAGDYDNLCNTGDCGCPTTTRKVQISCNSQACLSNFKRKRANVSFSNVNPDFVWILSYTVRGTIFDKDTKKAGSCKVVVDATYKPRTKGIDITQKKAQAVVNAALDAIFEVGTGKKAACVGSIKKAVQKATDATLAMDDTAEGESETGTVPDMTPGVETSPN